MSYDSNVFALQNTVNRFAEVVGFTKLAADGMWGDKTRAATKSTLSWISKGSCAQVMCVNAADAQAATMMVPLADTWLTAKTTIPLISKVGDQLALVHIATPLPAAGSAAANVAANALAPLTMPSWWSKLIDGWKNLAAWQKIGIGVLFGFGAMWIHKRVTTTRKG